MITHLNRKKLAQKFNGDTADDDTSNNSNNNEPHSIDDSPRLEPPVESAEVFASITFDTKTKKIKKKYKQRKCAVCTKYNVKYDFNETSEFKNTTKIVGCDANSIVDCRYVLLLFENTKFYRINRKSLHIYHEFLQRRNYTFIN